jgi:hypothetical protein
MNELELLLLRLEDLAESAENKEVKILTKALKRYFHSTEKQKMGFSHETKGTSK